MVLKSRRPSVDRRIMDNAQTLMDMQEASRCMVANIERALATGRENDWNIVNFWAGHALRAGETLPGYGMHGERA